MKISIIIISASCIHCMYHRNDNYETMLALACLILTYLSNALPINRCMVIRIRQVVAQIIPIFCAYIATTTVLRNTTNSGELERDEIIYAGNSPFLDMACHLISLYNKGMSFYTHQQKPQHQMRLFISGELKFRPLRILLRS